MEIKEETIRDWGNLVIVADGRVTEVVVDRGSTVPYFYIQIKILTEASTISFSNLLLK
jgi:hypothetical protein